MSDASTSGSMSPELRKVVERARKEPGGKFHSLAHLLVAQVRHRHLVDQMPPQDRRLLLRAKRPTSALCAHPDTILAPYPGAGRCHVSTEAVHTQVAFP